METVPNQKPPRKPDIFVGRSRIEISLQPEDQGNGNHSRVLFTVDWLSTLMSPSSARAIAKSLLVWASLAEARRARQGKDMPSTGQGEAP